MTAVGAAAATAARFGSVVVVAAARLGMEAPHVGSSVVDGAWRRRCWKWLSMMLSGIGARCGDSGRQEVGAAGSMVQRRTIVHAGDFVAPFVSTCSALPTREHLPLADLHLY